MTNKLAVSNFGKTRSGASAQKFTFTNSNGYQVEMLNYGATVLSVKTPDRDGQFANVNLGCPDIATLEANQSYLGASIGRFCGRIGGATFTIDGQTYNQPANNGPNLLHGGADSFDRKIWSTEPIQNEGLVGVRFSLTSPDGENGFPGTLNVTAEYLLTEDNELTINFVANTDKATHVNLTNHCYWNFAGAGQGDIYSHELQIHADQYLELDESQIPTGELLDATGTPMDFRKSKPIGADITQLTNTPQGYDCTYALKSAQDDPQELKAVARVSHQSSGRQMEIRTDQSAIQIYSSNYMDGTAQSGGHQMHSGIALETQQYPNAPNVPHFPSTLITPESPFQSRTILKFWAE